MVTHPIEYTACLSNTGVQVVPEFTVFQTPPEPTATYQTLLFSGCTAISAIRPDINPGPIFRSFNPEKVLSTKREAAGVVVLPLRWAKVLEETKRQIKMAMRIVVFIGGLSRCIDLSNISEILFVHFYGGIEIGVMDIVANIHP